VASLTSLRTVMWGTVLITLFIFGMFILAVSALFSMAESVNLSLYSTLLVATALAIIFMLIQLAISPAIIAASTRLRYIESGEYPWLERTVENLSEKSGVKKPRIAISPNNDPNAFVFGNSSSNMTLAVHQGLLNSLSEEEITGVIGHELGHIKHKDALIMTLLSALPLIAYMIARGTMALRWEGDRRRGEGGYIALAGIIALVVYFAAQLLVLKLSRLREHFSDAYSAYLTGSPRSLESALTKIAYGLSLSPDEPHGARALFISDPALAKEEINSILENKSEYDLDKDGVLDERELELAMEKEAKSYWTSVNTAFSTHPPTFKRIMLLRQIESEMASGVFSEQRLYAHI
jgi:heat shock protein HtpX